MDRRPSLATLRLLVHLPPNTCLAIRLVLGDIGYSGNTVGTAALLR